MMTDERVVAAMERYGGSFVKALAYLFRRADSENRARLKVAFPEYWASYTAKAQDERAGE